MKNIFEKSHPNRKGVQFPKLDVPQIDPADIYGNELIRTKLAELPELAENDVVRHFVNLSRRNFGVDNGFYPLGSCTMKYNPKINEEAASQFGLGGYHPLATQDQVHVIVPVKLYAWHAVQA